MTEFPVKYYEDCLMRKEGKGKWKEYWVVIRGSWMLFFANKNITDRNNFQGSLELSMDGRCTVSKRRNYSFPFYITTQRGTHLFKCLTNLQRHQWVSAISLAIKGSPPLPPPTYVPKKAIRDQDGDFVASWDTNTKVENSKEVLDDSLNNITDDDDDDEKDDDDDDEKDDDDDLSIPPGAIIVSTLPDDLTKCEDGESTSREKEKILNFINKGESKEHVPLNAVLSTGITGSTMVVQKRSINNQTTNTRLQLPKQLSRPLSKSTGSIQDGEFKSFLTSQTVQSDVRPSTSPVSPYRRTPLSYSPINSASNLKFSRHMASSAPDVKTLVMENDMPRS